MKNSYFVKQKGGLPNGVGRLLFFLTVLVSIASGPVMAQITATLAPTESTCQANGTISVSAVSGGAAPYKVALVIGPGVFNPAPYFDLAPNGVYSFSGLSPGTFTVSITDFNGAEKQLTSTVPGNYKILDYLPVPSLNTCANGTQTGKITVNGITDGLAPFRYRLTQPGTTSFTPVTGNAFTVDNLTPSLTYELQVWDNCDNFQTRQVQIPNIGTPNVPDPAIQYLDCAGNVLATFSASGGTGPYTYSVTAGPIQVGSSNTTGVFSLTAGTFTVRVIDQCNGGATDRSFTIGDKPPFNVYIGGAASTSCSSGTGMSGAIAVDVGGGIRPYQSVVVLDCAGNTIALQPDANGNYYQVLQNLTRPCMFTVIATDACGTERTQMFDQTAPGAPDAVLASGSQVICPDPGAINYRYNITAYFGPPYAPSLPFSFSVLDSNGSPVAGYPVISTNNQQVVTLPPGVYTYQIADACGTLSQLTSITVTTYAPPTLTLSTTNECINAGRVTLIGTNNNTAYPYINQYKIIAGPDRVGETNGSGIFSNLVSGGAYTFEFYDGCQTATVQSTIPPYQQPSFEVSFGALCTPATIASIQAFNLNPPAIVRPYTYEIIALNTTNGLTRPPQLDSLFNNLPEGQYNVRGYDACNNSFTFLGRIGALPPPVIQASRGPYCVGELFHIRIVQPVFGATYTYFQNGNPILTTTSVVAQVPANEGGYSVLVTVPGGCTAISDVSFTVLLNDKIETTATPGVCTTATNSYVLTGTISATNAVASQSLTVSVGSVSTVVTLIGNGPTSYTLSELPSDGLTSTVTVLSSATACGTISVTYSAPLSCTAAPAGLGDFVFVDTNKNGIQDSGEPPIPGVTVTLYTNGVASATTVTDASGLYSFTGLTSGSSLSYSVGFTTPTGYTATLANQGSDDAKDSDADVLTGRTQSVTLASGEFNPTLDAGFYLPCALTITPGITPILCNNAATGSLTVTVSGGTTPYSFSASNGTSTSVLTSLTAGTYSVTVTDAFGCSVTQAISLTQPAPLALSLTPTPQTCLNNVLVGGSLTVGSISGGTGSYAFLTNPGALTGTALMGLAPGSYTTTVTDANGCSAMVTSTINSAQCATAGLGDYVFLDANKNGIQDAGDTPIPGVTVTLYTNGVASATTVTDASGLYSFTGLTPGSSLSYSVGFGTPTGLSPTTANVGTDDGADSDADQVTGHTQSLTLAAGEFNPTLDAGFFAPTAGLGDYVFVDANKNGVQDSGEPPIPGVTVTLYTNGVASATTVTDASGLYSFTGLTPGSSLSYSVGFTTPTGYTATLANQGSDDTKDSDADAVTGRTQSVTLADGEFNPTLDAGYYLPSASLGDFVFVDTNKDGVQQPGEPGIPGVVVVLLDGTNSPIASTTTNASGLYSFTGLTPGVPYSVSFVAPSGYTSTSAQVGGDDTKDSDANPVTGQTRSVTLAPGENNPNLDAGFYLPCALTITSGITPILCNGSATGSLTVTASGGTAPYSFSTSNGTSTSVLTGLPAGTYSLTVTDAFGCSATQAVSLTQPAALALTLTPTPQTCLNNMLTGGSLMVGSITGGTEPYSFLTNPGALTGTALTGLAPGNYTTTVTDANGCSTTATATINPAQCALAGLGDFVFLDVNQNGVQDAGDTPIAGVIVTLYTNGVVSATTVTDASGLYSFTGLTPGSSNSYSVGFTAPIGVSATTAHVGSNTAIDSDADVLTGRTQSVTLVAGEFNPTLDAGYYPIPAGLGDFVFIDTNKDGQQDAGEPGLAGVAVTLYTNGVASLTTVTDASGLYSFTGLTPGSSLSYSVGFTTPSGYTATLANQGSDDTKDSDAIPSTGHTQSVTLAPGEFNPTLDAGFFLSPPTIVVAGLGDFVFVDANKNGVQDAGESPIAGVIVTLYTNGVASATTVTDASGLYSFTGLTPGNSLSYSVGFTTPAGYTATLANQGSDDTKDSDADVLTGHTQSVTLASGEFNPTLDAGFYIPGASLGDFVFEDTNKNGQQDAGEPGISGVTVTLLSSGTVVATTTTNASGLYSFTGLAPGVPYSVSFTAPAGYTATNQNMGNDATDSDGNPASGLTGTYSLTTGEYNPTVDMGYVKLAPSLILDKLVDKSRAKVGDILTYTIVLTNTGTVTATNVVVRDSSTTGLTYVTNSATAPAGTTFTQGSPISTWTVANLAAGQSLTLTFQAIADSTGILYNTASIPGDTAKVCTSVPIKLCPGDAYTLTAPVGRATYAWYRDGILMVDQTTNVLTITQAGSYNLRVNGAGSSCPDFSCCPVIIEQDSLPVFQAIAFPATCVGNAAQANGQLKISGFNPAHTYQYSAGATFTPAASLSGAPKVIPANGVLASSLVSPANATMYTIRVYNVSGCYVDQTVLLMPTVCGCPADVCVPYVVQQTKRAVRIGDPR